MITPIEKIKDFLALTHDISIGYEQIHFFPAHELVEEQTGYSIAPNGKSLITGQPGDWQRGWVAIGNDQLGDPIIADVNTPQLPIFSASFDMGQWSPIEIADSLDNFKAILSVMKKVSKGRTHPANLEKNPISDKLRIEVLTQIEQQNPGAELWFWESYFRNIEEKEIAVVKH